MSWILANKEKLMPLAEAYEAVTGKRPNVSVPWRHSQYGIDGIKLEIVIMGGKRMTSKEACIRFFEARTQQKLNGSTSPTSCPTGQQNQAAFEKAEKEIDRLTQPAKKGRKKKAVPAVA